MNNIRISASRLTNFFKCSFLFYCKDVLGLPEGPTHPRTIIGSLFHVIVENLKNPRHRHHYDIIKKTHDINNSKSLIRLINRWKYKYNLTDELLYDINEMLMVAINNTNFFNTNAKKIFAPEHEFLLKMDGYEIKGFIDDLCKMDGYYCITDYKTTRNRYTKDELLENYQSAVYQLYCFKKFGALSICKFIFVRHPPTKRLPNKHMQIVEIRSPEELKGFEIYLNYLHKVFSNFGYDDAISNYCKNKNFCKFVCPFKEPFEYRVLLDYEGKIVKMARMNEELKVENGQRAEIRKYFGCPKWYGHSML